MPSGATGEEDSKSDGGEAIATKKGKGIKKEIFDVGEVRLLYIRKARNMITSILSRKAHHDNVSEQTVHVLRKRSLYEDVLSGVNYVEQGKVRTRHQQREN